MVIWFLFISLRVFYASWPQNFSIMNRVNLSRRPIWFRGLLLGLFERSWQSCPFHVFHRATLYPSRCVFCVWLRKLEKKSSRQKVCHTKSRSQVVHHGDSVSPVVLPAKRASVSGKRFQIKTEKRKRPFLAASPQVARLPLLTSVPVTTCWQLTCRTWRMPPCWMSWNWLKATGEPDFSK